MLLTLHNLQTLHLRVVPYGGVSIETWRALSIHLNDLALSNVEFFSSSLASSLVKAEAESSLFCCVA